MPRAAGPAHPQREDLLTHSGRVYDQAEEDDRLQRRLADRLVRPRALSRPPLPCLSHSLSLSVPIASLTARCKTQSARRGGAARGELPSAARAGNNDARSARHEEKPRDSDQE